MMTTIRLRAVLRFMIILSCWLQAQQSVLAAQNVTIQDTDPSIDYQPPELWHSSTSLCSTCLNPGNAASFHEAIHPPAGDDDDDHPSRSTTSHDASSTTSSASPTETDPDSRNRNSSAGKDTRRALVKLVVPRLDGDDDGFVDPNVSMMFNFTGTAVYLFATQPPNIINANKTSSNMNLTFFMDGTTVQTVQMPNSPNSDYLSGQLVFSKIGLAEGAHQLLVQVGQNSTFIFERLIYTTEAQTTTSTTPESSPSPSDDPIEKKHNIATFGAAVGGSAGVLALFSLGLALSIIRRRHLAALRERRDHESLHTNASDDSPHMYGPAPFVPRFFPDTVIPTEPPTYMAALATNANNSTLLASLPPEAFGSTRSYADIPPSVPPPPLDDTLMIPPPPPFPVAVASPPLPPPPPMVESSSSSISEEGALRPPIARAGQSSHSTISVGTDSLTSAPAPELVPLLQFAVADTRPRSRASVRSVADPRASETKPTEVINLQEDVS